MAPSHDEKIFNCNSCDRKFKRIYNLNQHTIMVHKKKPTKCEICDKSFADERLMKSHISAKHVIQCKNCDAHFASREGLKQHISSIHEGRKLICDVCSATNVTN